MAIKISKCYCIIILEHIIRHAMLSPTGKTCLDYSDLISADQLLFTNSWWAVRRLVKWLPAVKVGGCWPYLGQKAPDSYQSNQITARISSLIHRHKRYAVWNILFTVGLGYMICTWCDAVCVTVGTESCKFLKACMKNTFHTVSLLVSRMQKNKLGRMMMHKTAVL